jgi:hypothetical protein
MRESHEGIAPEVLHKIERALEGDPRVYMSPTIRLLGPDIVVFEMWYGANDWTAAVHRQVRHMLRDAFRHCGVGDPLLPEGYGPPVMSLMLEEFPVLRSQRVAG